jgi:GH24 family phage-related lysozyme (muramidase)
MNTARRIPGKGVIPAAFLAALTAGSTLALLTELEGNILRVYPDRLAGGIPTFCAGKTDWNIPLGTTFTSDQCMEINKGTILKYGTGVLGCTKWTHLTPQRLVFLTMFAINVGIKGACSSQAFSHINAGRIAEGCRLIAYKPSGAPNWSYAGGKFVQGLHNRRIKEMNGCLDVQ